MAMLAPLGIEKGKPFQPDARQAQILTDATVTGEAMVRAMVFDSRYEGIRYRPDAHWETVCPPGFAVEQDVENSTQLDQRAKLAYEAFGMSASLVSTTLGIGQAYLGAYRDRTAKPLTGARRTGCASRPTRPPSSSGPSRCMRPRPAPRSATSSGSPTGHPGRTSWPMPMARWTSTQDLSRPPDPRTTGFRPNRAEPGSPISGSTARSKPTSTRAGRCPTSSNNPNSLTKLFQVSRVAWSASPPAVTGPISKLIVPGRQDSCVGSAGGGAQTIRFCCHMRSLPGRDLVVVACRRCVSTAAC